MGLHLQANASLAEDEVEAKPVLTGSDAVM